MLIKEVEQKTGIKGVNIRYYEKEGLIHPSRKANGYREYSEMDVERLNQIKVLRLLEVSLPEIQQVLDGNITLQEVMTRRIGELNKEEMKIKEIKTTCETIISENISIAELNEELLCGDQVTWKVRFEQIMKEDIDKKFIGKGIVYIIIWTVFGKVFMEAMFRIPIDDAVTAAIFPYVNMGLGILFILYGIGLSVYEGITGKDFLWVWARDWGGNGLGGLANSFTFCGIGVGILSTSLTRFLIVLLVVCIVIAGIRGYIMFYIKSSKKSSESKQKKVRTGRIMVITIVILIISFVVCVVIMYQDYFKRYPSDSFEDQKNRQEIKGIETVEITKNNWEDYFTVIDEIEYEKDENDEVIGIYQKSWFELKKEYLKQLDPDMESKVTFSYNLDMVRKNYKIMDPKIGEYEYTDDSGTSDTYYLWYETHAGVTIWDKDSDENDMDNNADFYLDYSVNEHYFLTYENFKMKGVKGELYFKE